MRNPFRISRRIDSAATFRRLLKLQRQGKESQDASPHPASLGRPQKPTKYYPKFLLMTQFLWRIQMPRTTIYHNRRYVSLNQRPDIGYKLARHIRAFLVHPISWNKLLVICDLMHVFYFCSALVWIIGQSLEHHHLAGIAFIRCLYSRAAYLVCFQDVHSGSGMGCGTLQRAEFDRTGLAADLSCDQPCKV